MTAEKAEKKSTKTATKTRKTTTKKLSPFEKWLDEIKSSGVEKVSIVMHDNPDPDAIASAFAVHKIMERVDVESEIFWAGELDHTQNKKFINITGITDVMTKLNGEKTERILNRFRDHPIVIVDTSCAPGTGNLRGLEGFLPEGKKIDLVVDHHEGQTVDPRYYHYESYGSCVAIFYEILSKLNHVSRIDPILATALYFGIEKDTDNLKHESTTDKDRDYHSKLKKKIDEDLYHELVHFKYPLEKLEVDQKCYKFLHCESGMVISGGGFVISQKKSFLASVADDLLNKYENINFVCVLGITYDEAVPGSEKLVVSVRNNGDVIDTDEFMKTTFGSEFGGRKGIGGGSSKLGSQLAYAIDAIPEGDNKRRDEIFGMLFEGWKKRIIATRKRMS